MALEVPTLHAGRVRLEPLSAHHSLGMFELWSAAEVCEHSGPAIDAEGETIELPAASRTESDRLLEFWLRRAREGTGFRWAVVAAEDAHRDFIGAVGFNALGTCAEYAYHVVPRFWGQGFAEEASHLALSWVFERGASKVEAFIEAANERSLRLAKRLGFRSAEETLRRPSRFVLGPIQTTSS